MALSVAEIKCHAVYQSKFDVNKAIII